MVDIAFLVEGQGFYPQIRWGAGSSDFIMVKAPVMAHYLNRAGRVLHYASVAKVNDAEWAAEAEWDDAGWRFRVRDVWSANDSGAVLTRRFQADKAEGVHARTEGVQLQLRGARPPRRTVTYRWF